MTTPVAAVALLLLAAGFAWLGRWQLDRAATNRALAERYAKGASRDFVEWPVTDVASVRFRRLRLNGRYESERQVLLDNMTLDGRAGYHVLTVFWPADGGPGLLVDRGFVPLGADRSVLPDVAVDESPRMIVGIIDELPRAALDLGPDTGPTKSPPVLSYPTLAEIEAALELPLAPFEVLLDPDEADGFARAWRAPGDLAARNLGYAVQWFALALAAATGTVALLRAAFGARRRAAGGESVR